MYYVLQQKFQLDCKKSCKCEFLTTFVSNATENSVPRRYYQKKKKKKKTYWTDSKRNQKNSEQYYK